MHLLKERETYSVGVNDTAGTGSLMLQLVWNGVGAPVEAPSDCGDCIFAFDLNYTFDAAASMIQTVKVQMPLSLMHWEPVLMVRTHCSTVQKVNGVRS